MTHGQTNIKSVRFEVEWFLVLVDDVNLLGENKHTTKKTKEAVASKETV
jgi:hypothetical protein